jgi:hypothetical protein
MSGPPRGINIRGSWGSCRSTSSRKWLLKSFIRLSATRFFAPFSALLAPLYCRAGCACVRPVMSHNVHGERAASLSPQSRTAPGKRSIQFWHAPRTEKTRAPATDKIPPRAATNSPHTRKTQGRATSLFLGCNGRSLTACASKRARTFGRQRRQRSSAGTVRAGRPKAARDMGSCLFDEGEDRRLLMLTPQDPYSTANQSFSPFR